MLYGIAHGFVLPSALDTQFPPAKEPLAHKAAIEEVLLRSEETGSAFRSGSTKEEMAGTTRLELATSAVTV
jgi:hypothetical protein